LLLEIYLDIKILASKEKAMDASPIVRPPASIEVAS